MWAHQALPRAAQSGRAACAERTTARTTTEQSKREAMFNVVSRSKTNAGNSEAILNHTAEGSKFPQNEKARAPWQAAKTRTSPNHRSCLHNLLGNIVLVRTKRKTRPEFNRAGICGKKRYGNVARPGCRS